LPSKIGLADGRSSHYAAALPFSLGVQHFERFADSPTVGLGDFSPSADGDAAPAEHDASGLRER
jgi:hypothetical protein